ncbi:MAG: flagellar biosynthesis regulator FlaF [Alphaproteobacteria bacterium]|jgi:flagellar protein FlaF|nr:flagellar biosynthesis regulator FlaF [Alphaproteobacteria bacterium]
MSGVDAYQRTLNQTGSMRDTEFRLLGQVTTALINAQKIEGEVRSDPTKMAQFADALNWNNQVWDLFADDCGTAGNQLPRELRGAIVSLGIWVKKETQAALNGDGDLASLIAVNRDIMKGLRNSAANQQAREQAAPPPPGTPSGLVIDSA